MRNKIINKLTSLQTRKKVLGVIKRVSISLTGIIAALGIALAPAAHVFASSAYDGDYQHVSSIKVNTVNFPTSPFSTTCSDTDLTSTWESYILDPSKWYNSTSFPGADTSFRTALANGGRWAVSTYNQWLGSGSYYTGVLVLWTEDNSLAVNWDSTNQRVKVTGSNLHEIDIAPRVVASGNYGDCSPRAWGYYTNEPYSVISTNKPYVATPTTSSDAGGFANLSVYSDYLNAGAADLTGYIGDEPTSSVGSIAAPAMGEVHCFNTGLNVTNIHITPSAGIAGDATLTYLDSPATDDVGYLYYPSESSSTYGMQVSCGDGTDTTDPSSPASTSVTNYQWYCYPNEYCSNE